MPKQYRHAKPLKRAVLKLLERAGYELRPVNHGETIEAVARLAERLHCSVVPDVGADEGEFARDLHRKGYRRDIVSLEPRS